MNLTQIFISLEPNWGGFSVKIRWSPKKKRSSPKLKRFFQPSLVISKKGLNQNSVTSPDQLWVRSRKKNSSFLVQITGSPSQLLPIPVWGLFSFLEQKSASKALKTCYFAYFSGQWGGLIAPPPPGYATEICTATTKTLSRHLSDCWGYILIWRIQLAMTNLATSQRLAVRDV